MVKLHIQNENVRINIATVIEALRKRRPLKEEHKRVVSLAVHRETGVLYSGVLEGEGYKPIQLHLDHLHHKVYITEDHEKKFDLEQLEKKGQHVLAETCHQLELILLKLHSIGELIHVEFDPSLDEVKGRLILHEAWHAITREEAESFLLSTNPGTYLFRKDRFAGCLEEILSAAKKIRIKCYTLTYLDTEKIVRDKTIVHYLGRWMFYDDDPTLSGDYYRSLDDLLMSVSAILKRPLQAIKAAS